MATTLKPMSFVTGDEVTRLVDSNRQTCLDVVSRAYLTHSRGESANPPSSFLRFPDKPRSRIIALPAYLGGDFEVAGIKWIASVPGNLQHGLPRASAVLILNDTETGFPYACLESSVISATRTAASAVLGAEVLAGSRSAAQIGFIGTGYIAEHIWRFFRDLGWKIGEFHLFDLNRAAAEKFASKLTEQSGMSAAVHATAEDVIAQSELVVLATVAGQPHLHDPELIRHNPVLLHISLRDLSPEIILAAQNFTDDIDHAVREQTSLHLAEQAAGHRNFIDGTIAGLIDQRLQRDPNRTAVFSPFGLGVLDLAIGKWVYEHAHSKILAESFFPAPEAQS